MRSIERISCLTAALVLVSALSLARVSIVTEGMWPDSWPKELEPYQEQARTVSVAHGIQETVYEIPFDRRDEFEKAWPHVLTLKSEGAPLVIDKSPSTYDVSGTTMQTGVRVLWPSGGSLELADGRRLEAGPPWPESIKSPGGELPEYVVAENGQWVRFDGKERVGLMHRARVDIVLVSDGKVVDLNRVPLPPQTPIVDNRFGGQQAGVTGGG
jgi:hypothetical protein